MTPTQVLEALEAGAVEKQLNTLYPPAKAAVQPARWKAALEAFEQLFGGSRDIRVFSAPGRTEIGGNHTDHQHGMVLAASVDMDVLCVAAPNREGVIRIQSQGYPRDEVALDDLTPKVEEQNKAVSLIRGIAARCRELGLGVEGFDAYTTSNVLKGSGLSSSAAFEVAVGTMISHLFNDGRISSVEVAKIGQYAENRYFGKPSGLLDQMASSVGGLVFMDFADPGNPAISTVDFDFRSSGHTLCIVDTKGSHADLTPEYAAIPAEMGAVAAFFGKERLREVEESAFLSQLAQVRAQTGDRAVLRAIHFFAENRRVQEQAKALEAGRWPDFLELINASGRSSFTYLQNVFTPCAVGEQGLSLALAVSESILDGRGACRVHGGGFAGTILAFVPDALVDTYRSQMQALFGEDAFHLLSIRPRGGVEFAISNS